MSLRQQASRDLVAIMESTSDFGWPITVTSPAGATLEMVGLSTDIGTTIDAETGLAVTGRRASAALAIASLLAAGFELPRTISDRSSKPWRVTFADIGGKAHTFKVVESMPDQAIGCITVMLEAYAS